MKIEGEKRMSDRFRVPKGYKIVSRRGVRDSYWEVQRGVIVVNIRFETYSEAVDWAWYDVRDRATKAALPAQPEPAMSRDFMDGVRFVNDRVHAEMKKAGYGFAQRDAVEVVQTLLQLLNGK